MSSEEHKLMDRIITQIEYYFGDINLNNDYFMKDIAQRDNGWVSIETLLKFNRLKSLIKDDKQLFTNCLKNSNSNLVELSESEDKVRRKPDKPLPQLTEEYKRELNERTLHVKGFPKDITLDEVMLWCKQLANIESVQMRRIPKDNQFKGCIFVTFPSKSLADLLINKEVLLYKDQILLKESLICYHERKREFYKEKKRFKSEARLRRQQEKALESQNGGQDMKDMEEKVVRVEAAVLKLMGLPRRLAYNKIKSYFSTFAKVAFVNRTDAKGVSYVQFSNKYDANNVLAVTKMESNDQKVDKILIEGNEVIAQVLTGEEEKEFWIESNKSYAKFKTIQKKKKNLRKESKPLKRSTSSREKPSRRRLLKSFSSKDI